MFKNTHSFYCLTKSKEQIHDAGLLSLTSYPQNINFELRIFAELKCSSFLVHINLSDDKIVLLEGLVK